MDPSVDADASAVREHGVVADLGREALETDDVEAVLRAAAGAVAETLGADRACVFEFDSAYARVRADETRSEADASRSEADETRGEAGRSEDATGTVAGRADRGPLADAARGDPVVVTDARPDDRLDLDIGPPAVAGAALVGVGPGEDPWGALGAFATGPREFTRAEVDFLRNVAAVIGPAVGTGEAREGELERYETIVENVNDGVYVVDEDGYFLLVNETYADLLGYDREELVGSHVSMVTDEAVRERAADLEATMSAGESSDQPTIEAEIETADGEYVPLEATFAIVPDDSEGHRIGVVRDLRERKERERQLSTLMANVPGMVYRCRNEPGWPMEFVSEGCLDLTGYDPAALESGEVSYGDDLVVADDREELWTAVQRGLDEDGSFLVTYRIETADGRTRWVRERGRAVSEDPTRLGDIRTEDDGESGSDAPDGDGESGEATVIEGVVIDVTERKRLEAELAESEQRYRTLVENFPNGAVGLFDEDLRYTAVGGSIIDDVGASPGDIVGQTIWERYPDRVTRQVEPHFRAALDGESRSFEIEFRGRHWRGYTLPVEDDDGDIFAGMMMVQDVTERREYERKLEESNERLEQFAYAASHDLQEPLRMVSSYLQLVERRYGDELDADGREFIDFAVDGADRMREMIKGLLEYSRVDTRGDPFEPVDLDAVLDDVREDLQVKIQESGATVTAEDLPTVEGDGSQLRQLFQNLLENAIEYSGDDPPRVHVGAERRDARALPDPVAAADADRTEWVVSVSDDGVGIDPEQTDRVFEVFQRVHADDHDGTGIGLALCERIVERHGGEIWVDSEPGEGTTFSFTLPATD